MKCKYLSITERELLHHLNEYTHNFGKAHGSIVHVLRNVQFSAKLSSAGTLADSEMHFITFCEIEQGGTATEIVRRTQCR